MAGFRFDLFKGIRPRISKRKLKPGEAQSAVNTKIGSADLEPWTENRNVSATFEPYNTRAIFLYENSNTNQAYWFQWTDYVDVARGPIKGDSLDRVYYTGDGTPKITYNTLQSAPPYPSLSYDLGVPKPLTRLQATGEELPEDLDANSRRTSDTPGSKPSTGSFEIVNAEFTVYPGTGTANDTWRIDGLSQGDIYFKVDIGDTFKVLSVIDVNTITIGSATGTGAVAATLYNDKTSINYWHAMDEQGSTQEADFIGWRIPDGMRVVINDHRLRVGDVIRVTRLDSSTGLQWNGNATTDLFELSSSGTTGDWGIPIQGEDSIYRHENVRLGKSADGVTRFELSGGFYYDVDRISSINDSLEDRTYVYTYVSSIGEEGPPSDASALVSSLDGDTVELTGFDLGPAGFRDINRIRIYRTNATSVGTEYQFVKEVTFDEVTVNNGAVDTVEAAYLGEILQTTTWFPPPAKMQGIATMPNGMMVGFKGKEIFFCEPYQPHAYPPEYDQAVDYNIVALASFGNSIAVLTEGTPYIITGSHPRNVNIRPYKINQACLNKESVATSKDSVYYASPDGLVEIGVNGARVTTDTYAWKKDWANFDPDKMVGAFHDGKYFGFYGADNTVVPQPTGSVAVTGTLYSTETFEADIVAGGKTIILTLTGDTWVTGTDFDSARDDILFNIRSDNNEPTGWNAVRSTINVSNVVRTDNVTVTITLPAISSYSVVENENLTVKAPAIALANQVLLQAPEKPIIYKDNIYSTEAIVTTSASTIAPNVPEILVSNEAVGNWIRINAPSGLEQADQPNLSDAAYHQTLQRWAVVGWNAAGPQINNCVVLTADDIDDSAAWVERSLPTATNSKNGKTIIYDEVTDSFFAGGDSFLMFSPNGINWTMGSLPTTLSSDTVLKFSRAPQGGGGTTPRLYAVFSGSKKVARSANLASSPLTTTWEDLGAATTSGTALTAIASGTGLVFVANNAANAEIGYFIQGGTSYTEIGDLGMDVSDMAYGNGRLVCISANGRIQYGDAPSDLLTIGNWSAVSGAIDSAGTRDLAKIAYDGGGDGRIGYGFIATLSASGAPGDYVVYTSPDAVTWTLQSTVSDTSDALGIGTKYPQADLGEAPGIVITLSGESYYAYALTAPAAKFIVKADGTIHRQKNASTSVQIDALTDWIQPNYFANGTYDVRVTDVVWLRGSTWQASPGADGSWFALSSDRTWSVQDGHVRFKFEIRKDAGATLASATYILGSEQYIDPRGDDDDGGFIEP